MLEPGLSDMSRPRDGMNWKVYKAPEKPGRKGEFVAATKNPTEAALLVSHFGPGAQIRHRHHTLVWTEGKETFRAADSLELAAHTCLNRLATIRREVFEAEQRRQSRGVQS